MTLPSHKSHVFQPLDVSYFNPFKTSFKKVRDGSMSRSKLHGTKQDHLDEIGRPILRAITHQKKSSLDVRLRVYGFQSQGNGQ